MEWKDPNGQWQVLEIAGMITQRPAPGVDEQGNASDDGCLGREGFFMIRAIMGGVVSPVTPPSAGKIPKLPIDSTPLGSDPASRGL